MRFVLMFKIDVLGTSRGRHRLDVTLGPLEDVFRTFLQKPKTKIQLTLQAHIWRNKIKNNAVKMYMYERFKTDVLGTSQGNHPTDVFSGRFEDVRRMFLQNVKNSNG